MIEFSLTSILAAWGAAASTLLVVGELRRRRRRVSVQIQLTMMPSHLCDADGYPALAIRVRNHGFRAMDLVGMSVEAASGTRIALPARHGEQPYPVNVDGGETHDRYLECDTAASLVDSDMQMVRFIVRDASGREYASRFVDPASGQPASRRSARRLPHVRLVRSA